MSSPTEPVAARGPLAGAVGIVTGGGKGLGRAFALDLARAGAYVVVNNRNRRVDAAGLGPADHVVAEINDFGGRALAEHSDVTHPDAAQAMLDVALREYGRLDFLVTSAGVSNPEMFHKSTPSRFDAVIDTNLGGTAHLALLCSAHLRAAGGGRIVLVASTAGLHGEPTASAYTASKGAVIALARAVAVEGERRNVFTNVVLPYATTQMTEGGMTPQYRELMAAHLVAPLVTALVDRRSQLNGQVLVVGGGGMRAASSVEYGTVPLPPDVGPEHLAALVEQSRAASPRTYRDAYEGFCDFAADVVAFGAQ